MPSSKAPAEINAVAATIPAEVSKPVSKPTTTAAKPAVQKPATKAVSAKAAVKPTPKAVTKAVLKPAAKAPAKPIAKASAKLAAKPVLKSAAADKPAKDKKIKMVRDSISIPKAEYLVLDDLKVRAGKLGVPIKKTELIRAGIKALAALPDAAFLLAVRAVPSLKTGRPAKSA